MLLDTKKLTASLLDLIIQTSTNLPDDVRVALDKAKLEEEIGTRSSLVLDTVHQNVKDAFEGEVPVCQDTGMPTFLIHTPVGVNQLEIKKSIYEAIAEATRL